MKNNKKGITLIALVITIIILLILAGVTINLILGENGILKNAEIASQKYENKAEQEQNELAKADDYISNYRGNTGNDHILWEGKSTEGAELQLSENLSNYRVIEIYFRDGPNDRPCPILKYDVSEIIDTSGNDIYLYCCSRRVEYGSIV